jgi:hypothetical protein
MVYTAVRVRARVQSMGFMVKKEDLGNVSSEYIGFFANR